MRTGTLARVLGTATALAALIATAAAPRRRRTDPPRPMPYP